MKTLRSFSRVLFAAIFCMILSSARAQYVTVQDTNFGNWLHSNGYAACLTGNSTNGWQLDTACTAVLTAQTINCSGSSIVNLYGIHYFKHLDTLICRSMPIATISDLPDSLLYLDCSYSNLNNNGTYSASIQTLPNTLTYLDCSHTNIGILPRLSNTSIVYMNCSYIGGVGTTWSFPQLPNTTTRLICNNANMEYLDSLSSSLTYLNCSENNIGQLYIMPAPLDTLICYGQTYQQAGMTNIDSLPPGLRYIDCHNNSYVAFPRLPTALTYLDFSNNGNYVLVTHSLPSLASTSLVRLYCYNSSLSSLSALPSTIRTIIAYGDSLPSLPALPASLDTLDCSYNVLSALPALPANLLYLNCKVNQLTAIPTQPNSLTYLAADSNAFTSFPNMSSSLVYLNASFNNVLTGLPALPSTLSYLICKYDGFATLPALPASLTYLDCSYFTGSGALTSLPALPAGLQHLDFSYCPHVTVLPALPATLTYLNCEAAVFSGAISALPPLPAGLTYLNIENTGVTCLPPISQPQLDYFYAYGPNGPILSCLPNRFTALHTDIPLASLPLCAPTSGCQIDYNIGGNVHSDTASSCLQDSIHQGVPINNVKVQLWSNNQVIQQFYTSGLGQYSFKTPALSSYQVTVDTTLLPFVVTCPSASGISVVLSPSDSAQPNDNIGLSCGPADYGAVYIYAGRFRPQFTTQVSVTAGDVAQLLYGVSCHPGQSGTVTTVLSGAVQYVSAAPGALTPSVSGNILTYTIADLDSLHPGSLDVILTTDSAATVGSSVCITTAISSATPDINSYDDTLSQCFTIVSSFDPNYKEAYPVDTFQSGWLTYTVHFQNTGTDTAFKVVVADTLSANVNAATFRYLASSSPAQIKLSGNICEFTFLHINLPDSAQNPAGSQGWIQYQVKALTNLTLGSEVKNTAYIYFDNNPAVVTNTTVNIYDTIASPLGIRNITAANTVSIYPNPNKGSFTLMTANSIGETYTITDMLGNVIAEKTISSNRQTIQLSEAIEGVYTLTVRGAAPQRFVIVR